MDATLLKAIQEGSLSPEVMAVLEAKFWQQAATSPIDDDSLPPPPPPPLPPSSSTTVSPTKWVIVSEKGQKKRWQQSSGSQGLGSDPAGSSTPDEGSSHAAPIADPLKGMCDVSASSSTPDDEDSHTQHPLKGKVRKVLAREKRSDKQDDEEKIPLTCCGCRTVVAKASEFLLTHEGEGNCESWAGGHWGHCFECSRFNTEDFENESAVATARKKFMNAAKKSWLATTKAVQRTGNPRSDRHMEQLHNSAEA